MLCLLCTFVVVGKVLGEVGPQNDRLFRIFGGEEDDGFCSEHPKSDCEQHVDKKNVEVVRSQHK